MKWYHLALGALSVIVVYELFKYQEQQLDRNIKYFEAESFAHSRGKPFLVVGTPDGKHGCGDLNLDIKPYNVCPNEIKADVQDLHMFEDKQFGAVFASHVLEHIEDIEAGFSELSRVADKVFISHPPPDSLFVYSPGHKWKIFTAPPTTNYVEYRRIGLK